MQETPIRKITKGFQNQAFLQDVFDVEGNPIIPTILNDKLLTRVINSNIVQGILHNPAQSLVGSKLQISSDKLISDFHEFPTANKLLDSPTKEFLKSLPIDCKTVQSATVNGIVYDKLFQDLDDRKIDYLDDCILGPTKAFRNEFIAKEPFRQRIDKFVQELGDFFVDDDEDDLPPPPPIPNYSTYPGDLDLSLPDPPSPLQVHAREGKFPVLPGVTKLAEPHSINNNSLYNPAVLDNLAHDMKNAQVNYNLYSN